MNSSIFKIIVDKMFSFVGKTIEDSKTDLDFYRKYKLTKEEYEEWYSKSLIILQKHHPHIEPAKLKQALDLFDIHHGLLYHYQREPTIFTEEEEELFASIKRKKIKDDSFTAIK